MLNEETGIKVSLSILGPSLANKNEPANPPEHNSIISLISKPELCEYMKASTTPNISMFGCQIILPLTQPLSNSEFLLRHFKILNIQ